MPNEDLRYLTDTQKRQLDSIINSIQMSNAIPANKKQFEIQKATEQFVANLKVQGKLKIPEVKKGGAFEGLLELKPYTATNKLQPLNNQTAYTGYKHTVPIMLH